MYNLKNLEVDSNFLKQSVMLPFDIPMLYELWILDDENA